MKDTMENSQGSEIPSFPLFAMKVMDQIYFLNGDFKPTFSISLLTFIKGSF